MLGQLGLLRRRQIWELLMLELSPPNSEQIEADLLSLAEFRDPEAPGWTRTVFSVPYRRSRTWIAERMESAGLKVHMDSVGNVIGRLPGREGLPALVTGSHTDTVSGGGKYDGTIGVIGGIAVAEMLLEQRVELRHDLAVIDFVGEEPNDFGLSCIGSRAITGTLLASDLARTDRHGTTLRRQLDLLVDGRSDPGIAAWSPDEVKAFVELHIEQGPVLESASMTIGVVTGIVGVARFSARFDGRRDHAGTTPMDIRCDAATAAAAAMLAVEGIASGGPGVGTTGRLEVQPGSVNIVPQFAQMWSEFRSIDANWLNAATELVSRAVEDEATARRVVAQLDWISEEPPVVASSLVIDAASTASGQLGYRSMKLPSGAEHDANKMALLGPMGMIFVPSAGGRSHCPEEFTSLRDVVAGVHTLCQTLITLDGDTP